MSEGNPLWKGGMTKYSDLWFAHIRHNHETKKHLTNFYASILSCVSSWRFPKIGDTPRAQLPKGYLPPIDAESIAISQHPPSRDGGLGG